MHLMLYRYAYTPTETQGRLIIGDTELWTIERPWVPSEDQDGGEPFKSCVPDGDYDLIPYERANGDKVLALVNPNLGVHLFKEDGIGRYAILIHAGNWVDDVVGCIAPGTDHTIANNRVMVTNSKAAMRKLNAATPFADQHTLTIHDSAGAIDS